LLQNEEPGVSCSFVLGTFILQVSAVYLIRES
jgi:hypothetical protein